MNVPTPEQIPDLSRLKPNSIQAILQHYFNSAGPTDYRAYALWMNTIRLGDLCLREYQSARAALMAWYTEDSQAKIANVLRASGHFEACISATERMLRHVKALRSTFFVEKSLKQLLPKNLLLLRGDQERLLIDMRDAITHFEGLLLKGEIPEGSSLSVVANADQLEIGDFKIPIKRFADWITELHACARRLSDYNPGADVGERADGSGLKE